MAWAVRLTGFSKKDGSVLLSVEPCWWDIGELCKIPKLKWVTSRHADVYRDDDVDISVAKARALHEQFKPYAFQGIYALRDTHEFIKPDLDAIQAAVGKDAKKYSRFHVCIFEWGSGM